MESTPAEQASSIQIDQKITPFLWFDHGKVEEAVHFYTSIFKNSKILSVNTSPGETPDSKKLVKIVTFVLDGLKFMAVDAGPMFTFSPAISLFVNCKTQGEVDELWDKLSAGGEKQQCGWLKDRYGISWQIIPETLGQLLHGDPIKSKNVFSALLKMTKIDIQGLKDAYEKQ